MPRRAEPHLERRDMSALVHWTRWCFETCLLYGCDPATASRVAAHFCDAIRKEPHAH